MSEELVSKNNLIKELKEWLSEFEGIPETLYGQGYDDAIKAAIAIVENEVPIKVEQEENNERRFN